VEATREGGAAGKTPGARVALRYSLIVWSVDSFFDRCTLEGWTRFVDACLPSCFLIFFHGWDGLIFGKDTLGFTLCAKSERKIRCGIYNDTPADLATMSSAMSLVNDYCCSTSSSVSIHSSFLSNGLERWI
jgi:hypothetical protein